MEHEQLKNLPTAIQETGFWEDPLEGNGKSLQYSWQKSHGQGSLWDYSPGSQMLDTAEQ